MADFTLRQLRYALALSETAHFGRAAELCNVTQSGLSQQIKQLEAGCGVQLFERRSRDVQATPFGRDFLARAREVTERVDTLARFVAEHGGVPDRPVRFGLIPTVAPYLLPDIYPALSTAMPDTRFSIRESQTDQLLAALDSGDLDLALIATDPPRTVRLETARLFADPFVLAAAGDAIIAAPVDLAGLPPEDILLLEEGHCFRDQAMAACAMRDPASENFAATSLSTIVEFVANGQGVTLLPAISLRKEAADTRIATYPLAAPGAERILSLVWRKSSPFGTVFGRVADVIRTAGQSTLAEAVRR